MSGYRGEAKNDQDVVERAKLDINKIEEWSLPLDLRIIMNTIVQVIRNVVDRRMPLDEAIDAARIHQGFVPDDIRYERGRPPQASVLTELRRRGHKLSAKTNVMGDANSVLVSNGSAYGYADPREGGAALAR